MKLQELAKKQDDFRSVYLHPGSYQAACLAAGSVLQVRMYMAQVMVQSKAVYRKYMGYLG
jgi:hypothetical protein